MNEEARGEKSSNYHRCSPTAWATEGRKLMVAGSFVGLEEQRVKLGSPAGKPCKKWLSQQRHHEDKDTAEGLCHSCLLSSSDVSNKEMESQSLATP